MSGIHETESRPAWDRTSARLRAFPLRFDDARLERLFTSKWFMVTRRSNRYWKLLSLGGFAFLSVILWIAAAPGFLEFQWFRFAVCLPLQAIGAWHAFAPRFSERTYYGLFLVTSLATFGNALYSFHFSVPGDALMYLYEAAVVFVFCHSYFAARWVYIWPFSLISTGVALVSFVMLDPLTQIPDLPVDMLLLGTIGMAITCNTVSYSKEDMARRNFREIRRSRILARRAEKMAARAKDATEAKARFLAVAAHELRTPLNAITGYAELIRYGIAGPVETVEVKARSLRIETNAKHLGELVEMVLEVTRARDATTSDSNLVQVGLSALLDDCAARANAAGVKLKRPRNQYSQSGTWLVETEENKLRIILNNLISLNHSLVKEASDWELRLADAADSSLWIAVVPTGMECALGNLGCSRALRPMNENLSQGENALTQFLANSLNLRLQNIASSDGRDLVALNVPANQISRKNAADEKSYVGAGSIPDIIETRVSA